MLRVVSQGLWRFLAAKANRASVKRAAIAYLGKSPPIRFGEGDLLIVDASDASIKAGRTSAAVLRDFAANGAELFSQKALHAKVMLIDDWAVIGSANASQNSYIEAAMVTDRIDVAGQVERLITDLTRSGRRITKPFLTRILKLPVTKRPFGPRGAGGRNRSPQVTEPRAWLVSTRGDATYQGNADNVDAIAEEERKKVGPKTGEMDWFFTGKGYFPTAIVGDIFIECHRPTDRVSSMRCVRVYPPALLKRIYSEPGTRVKTFHLLFPSRAEHAALTWSEFMALAKRAGVHRAITYRSNIALSKQQCAALQELWPK